MAKSPLLQAEIPEISPKLSAAFRSKLAREIVEAHLSHMACSCRISWNPFQGCSLLGFGRPSTRDLLYAKVTCTGNTRISGCASGCSADPCKPFQSELEAVLRGTPQLPLQWSRLPKAKTDALVDPSLKRTLPAACRLRTAQIPLAAMVQDW